VSLNHSRAGNSLTPSWLGVGGRVCDFPETDLSYWNHHTVGKAL